MQRVLLVITSKALLVSTCVATWAASSDPVVNAPVGTIRGRVGQVLDLEVEEFRGVPYAKPPVGELRFAHPQPFGKVGNFLAQHFPHACPQPNASALLGLVNATASEDCLYLNVFRKAGTKATDRKAVIVTIHGGGFAVGSSFERPYDSAPLAALGDVVTVSVAYRLGILGFADMMNLAPGNLGLHDQRLALQWIQENIEAFGGDPKRVTLMGVSAGSISVNAHIITPLNRGTKLFHAAIMDSGVMAGGITDSAQASFNRMVRIAKQLGCNTSSGPEMLACLQAADVERLIELSFDIEGHSPIMTFIPTVDGVFFPKNISDMFREDTNRFAKVKIMIGAEKDEGTLFADYYMDGRPFPKLTTEEKFLDWCAKLAYGYNIPVDVKNDTRVRQVVVREYFRKYPNPFLASARFLGDGLFRCPVNAFVKHYAHYNQNVYVYRYERRLRKAYLHIDPKIFGVFHLTAYLHFTGTLLGSTNPDPVDPEDKQFFLDSVEMVSKFAKTDEPPNFRGIKLPDFAKYEGVSVFNKKWSVRTTLPSEPVCKLIFNFFGMPSMTTAQFRDDLVPVL